METIDYKNILKEFRAEIAKLENEQKIIKPQRKTVHFKGERTMGPAEATYTSKSNSYDLRVMYAAYNLIRGKGFDVTEHGAKPLNAKEYYERTGYHLDKELEGRHPLFLYMDEIQEYLTAYGFKFPSHEEEYKDYWGEKKKKTIFDYDNYEKIVCIGE
jgi:hypothetical protein